MMRAILHSRWFTLICAIGLIVFGVSLARREPAWMSARREEARIQEQITELRNAQTELDDKSAFYQSSAFRERQARLKLNYQKPGEHVVYVYHPAEPAEVAGAVPRPLNNFEKWWYYLIGK